MQNEANVFDGGELDEARPDEDATLAAEGIALGPVKKESRTKRKMIGLCLLGLVIALTAAGFAWKYLHTATNAPEVIPQNIPELQLTQFDSFVIPYTGGKNFSYISIGVAFYLPDPALREEMVQKKYLLRGAIYELIGRKTQQGGWYPSLPQLKELIRKAVNEQLAGGKIHEFFITRYLVI